jgi:amino acid adenylation domain-containing protein
LPDKPGVVVGRRAHRFLDIDQASDRLACALQRMGLRRGDRVAAMLDNGIEMVIALWSAMKAGGVFVPISPGTKPDKLGLLLSDCAASVLIAGSRLRQQIAAAAAHGVSCSVIWADDATDTGGMRLADIIRGPYVSPHDPGLIDQDLCMIIYTSGSTGRPKGVMLTHRNIYNNVWSISTYLENRVDDVVICVLPLSFDYGLFQVLTGARVGFTVVVEKSFAFPYDTLRRIGEWRVTGLPGVPTFFARMLESAPFAGLDLSSLRYLSNTAAALPAAHIAALRQHLPQARIFSMYGLTECTRVSFLEPSLVDTKPTSVGRAMPNSEAYIVGENGCRCGPLEVGELVVRGTSVMRGYWQRPEETARTLREGDIPGEKVLFTGDLFWKDEDGDLYFVGRHDDVFKCRGEKVSPREVEACLFELNAVAEAAVIGVPHDFDGMAIKAYVVPRAGHVLTEAMLQRQCARRLEARLVPRYFELATSLPKTDSGKITKSVLRREQVD